MTGEHKEIIRDSEEWKDSSMDKCLAEMAKGGFTWFPTWRHDEAIGYQ